MDEPPKLTIYEEELIKLIEEYLASRDYHVSLRTLEKESSVINSDYSDEVLFLRELVLDGDYDEVLQFGESLKSNQAYDQTRFNYIVLRQKFIELIYLKAHILDKQNINTVSEVMRTLSKLEKHCKSKEEYNNLCWLLTLPDLNSHEEFQDWNIDVSRLKCFDELLDCLSMFMPLVKRNIGSNRTASKDRLLQLIVKGLFYETCTQYCQTIANSDEANSYNFDLKTNMLENGVDMECSSNLLSWVLGLPAGVFELPFNLCDIDVCYTRPSNRKNKINQGLINGTLDSHKDKKKKMANETPYRDTLNLTGVKSKSFDYSSPKILSSSFPTADLRRGLNNINSTDALNKKGVSVLHSSLNIGRTKGIDQKLEKSGFALTSPNVPPVMSSSAAEISPCVSREPMKAQEKRNQNEFRYSTTQQAKEEEKAIRSSQNVKLHSSQDPMLRSSQDVKLLSSQDPMLRSSQDIKFHSSQDALLRSSQDVIAARNFQEEEKAPVALTFNSLKTDVSSNLHQEKDQSVSAPKKPVAFEVFEPKTPDKELDEKRRREEIIDKLKKHEQSRQDSLKSLLSDESPGKTFFYPFECRNTSVLSCQLCIDFTLSYNVLKYQYSSQGITKASSDCLHKR